MLSAGITTTDPFTRLHVIAMQIQGLWPVAGLGRKAAFLHRSFGVLITIFYGLFTASMFIDAFISRDNLEALTGNLNISLLYCSGIAKATAHLFTRDTFFRLVNLKLCFLCELTAGGNLPRDYFFYHTGQTL